MNALDPFHADEGIKRLGVGILVVCRKSAFQEDAKVISGFTLLTRRVGKGPKVFIGRKIDGDPVVFELRSIAIDLPSCLGQFRPPELHASFGIFNA